jgi:hypothetical protein
VPCTFGQGDARDVDSELCLVLSAIILALIDDYKTQRFANMSTNFLSQFAKHSSALTQAEASGPQAKETTTKAVKSPRELPTSKRNPK